MLGKKRLAKEERLKDEALDKASDLLHKTARKLKSSQLRRTLKHYGDLLQWVK